MEDTGALEEAVLELGAVDAKIRKVLVQSTSTPRVLYEYSVLDLERGFGSWGGLVQLCTRSPGGMVMWDEKNFLPELKGCAVWCAAKSQ